MPQAAVRFHPAAAEGAEAAYRAVAAPEELDMPSRLFLTFSKTLDLPYPLLSDFPSLETIKKFGVENQIGNVTTAKRSYFIIDRKGIVRFKRIMHSTNPEAPFLPNEVLSDEIQRINQGY